MAASELSIPDEVIHDFIEHLHESYDETTAIAYEQMRLQKAAGNMGRMMIGHLMEAYFSVPGVPEDNYEN